MLMVILTPSLSETKIVYMRSIPSWTIFVFVFDSQPIIRSSHSFFFEEPQYQMTVQKPCSPIHAEKSC